LSRERVPEFIGSVIGVDEDLPEKFQDVKRGVYGHLKFSRVFIIALNRCQNLFRDELYD